MAEKNEQEWREWVLDEQVLEGEIWRQCCWGLADWGEPRWFLVEGVKAARQPAATGVGHPVTTLRPPSI